MNSESFSIIKEVIDNLQEECDKRGKNERLETALQSLEKVLILETRNNLTALSIQEEDRHRIARELHDSSLQNLVYLIRKIELSSLYIDKDPIRAKLELAAVNQKLKATIEEIRNTIYNLRPMAFDDLGLKAAFEKLVSQINENMKFEMDIDIEDVSCETNVILVTIYRIVQECLTNIVKHAEATKIVFHTKNIEGNYHIVIKDNGKGFIREEKKINHFGLSLIQERIHLINGKICITSKLEEGTKIEIDIPIKN